MLFLKCSQIIKAESTKNLIIFWTKTDFFKTILENKAEMFKKINKRTLKMEKNR